MTEDAAFEALIAYLNSVNAAAITLGNPGALVAIDHAYKPKPRPRGDYATVSLQSERDLGEADCNIFREVTVSGVARGVRDKVRAHEWLFRIDIFSRTATDAARILSTALRAEEASLSMAPLSVRRVYPAITATAMNEGQGFAGRASVDVSIGAIVRASVLTDFIEHGAVDVHSVRPAGEPGFDRREPF